MSSENSRSTFTDVMPAPNTLSASPGIRQRILERFGRGGVAVLVLVAIIGVVALERVIDGKFPWDKTIMKRVSQGLPLVAKDYRIIGVWWGSVITVVISGVLLACSGWWLPTGRITVNRPIPTPPRMGRWIIMALVVILSGAAWLRAPLLAQSLWNDEEFTMRRFAHGKWSEDKDGRREFLPVTWTDTLFDNHTNNNHLLSSVVTRTSLRLWRSATGAPRSAFNETALRMPALIAGLLTLVLLVVLGVEMGLPWAGLGAAGLLAVHPWHVRYAAEARGYSLMLFFLCLALIGLIRAFRTNGIGAWMLFVLGEAACLLSFAGALYPVAILNAVALMEFLARREPRRIGTLIGFNLLAAIPVMVWTLPSVPQILARLSNPDNLPMDMGWPWLRDLGCFLLSGSHYGLSEMNIHLGTTWQEQLASSPLFHGVVCLGLPVLAVFGLVASVFNGTAARLAIGSIVLGGVVAYAHNAIQQNYALVQYLCYLLIPAVLLAPVALTLVLRKRERIQGSVILLMVALFAWATHDISDHLIRHDRQPMRQTVAFIRDAHPEAVTACFGVSGHNTQSYDPFVRILDDESDLDRALADAKKKDQPFFVYFCGTTVSTMRNPDVMKRILDPAAFAHIRDFPGLEAIFSYSVYRALPPAPARADIK